ncbi:hypothetical protein Tco_0046696 [Tanacetum coccineum]
MDPLSRSQQLPTETQALSNCYDHTSAKSQHSEWCPMEWWLGPKKKGANHGQHSRDQQARSGGLWSGGLELKRGANRDQHSRDQRGRWLFKAWSIVSIPHRPSMGLVDGL